MTPDGSESRQTGRDVEEVLVERDAHFRLLGGRLTLDRVRLDETSRWFGPLPQRFVEQAVDGGRLGRLHRLQRPACVGGSEDAILRGNRDVRDERPQDHDCNGSAKHRRQHIAVRPTAAHTRADADTGAARPAAADHVEDSARECGSIQCRVMPWTEATWTDER